MDKNPTQRLSEIVKAWEDGKTIQLKNCYKEWVDKTDKVFCTTVEYRIKPETIKYRLFLWKTTFPACRPKTSVHVAEFNEQMSENREDWTGFIRWITDWIEVEV